jgi:hypothetical protein
MVSNQTANTTLPSADCATDLLYWCRLRNRQIRISASCRRVTAGG